MRKIIFTVILLLTAYSSAIFAEALNWKTSKADALATAKSQGKYVLLASCGSESYTEQTFSDPNVQDFIRQHFVLWFSVANRNNENYTGDYGRYMRGLEDPGFPFVAVIDPTTDQPLKGYQFSHAKEQPVTAALQKLAGTPPSHNSPPQPVVQNSDRNDVGSFVWQTSKADALAIAKKQGKRVLLFGGMDTCGTCQHVRNKIFEEPAVKALLQQSFVLWYAKTDGSNNEFWTYAKGLGNDWRIPLLAVIDPNSPDSYVERNISQAKSRQEQQAWLQQIHPWLQRVAVRNTSEPSPQPPNMQPVPPPANPNRPTQSSSTEPPAFAGMVAAHNSWRQRVGVPPLTWSTSAAKVAQSWANQLKNTQNCQMSHNPDRGEYGENIYWSSGRSSTSKDVVNSWGSEVQDYDYATNQCNRGKMCGHYTQVVWRDTTQVGCGKASCDSVEIWVCNYSPPGNYNGEKPY